MKMILLTIAISFFFVDHAFSAEECRRGRLDIFRDPEGYVHAICFPTGQRIDYDVKDGVVTSKTFSNFTHEPNDKPIGVGDELFSNGVFREMTYPLTHYPDLKSLLEEWLGQYSMNRDDFYRDIWKWLGATLGQTNSSIPEAPKLQEEIQARAKKHMDNSLSVPQKRYLVKAPVPILETLNKSIRSLRTCSPAVGSILGDFTNQGGFRVFANTPEAQEYAKKAFDPLDLFATAPPWGVPPFILVVGNPGDPKNLFEWERQRSVSFRRFYYGDELFNPATIGSESFNWVGFRLIHEYGHLLQYRSPTMNSLMMDIEWSSVILDEKFPKKWKSIRDQVDSVWRFPLEKLREQSAQFYAVDSMAGCMKTSPRVGN